MKITYNSPVVLTFTLIAVSVLLLNEVLTGLISNYFVTYPHFQFSDPLDYFRLFSHVIGHANWEHLVGNFAFILLIGPILEEKYGAKDLVMMMAVTALVTGILNALFFHTGLLGASGIVFMMILLGSMVNMKKGTLPLTFLLIAALYIGKEMYAAFAVKDNISQFGHIIGGICGTVFGFALNGKK